MIEMNTPVSSAEPFLARFRSELPMLRRRFGVRKLSIFGSYVRGEQHAESDLDVLVEFDRIPSMLGYLKLEETLSKIAGVKVDLVMKRALKKRIGGRILSEAVAV